MTKRWPQMTLTGPSSEALLHLFVDVTRPVSTQGLYAIFFLLLLFPTYNFLLEIQLCSAFCNQENHPSYISLHFSYDRSISQIAPHYYLNSFTKHKRTHFFFYQNTLMLTKPLAWFASLPAPSASPPQSFIIQSTPTLNSGYDLYCSVYYKAETGTEACNSSTLCILFSLCAEPMNDKLCEA